MHLSHHSSSHTAPPHPCYYFERMSRAVAGRRLLYLLSFCAPVWALFAYATGGVGVMLGPLRVSSRQPLRPLIVGVLAAAAYLWLYDRTTRSEDGAALERWTRPLLRVMPFILVAGALGVAVAYGSFVAGGSDSYGYVSQARLWLTGDVKVEQPWVQQFSWNNREWIAAPLGYRPAAGDGTLVPTYSAGLPMLMALALVIFGPMGPFLIVPASAAVAVGATYLLGRDTAGHGVGVMAAAMLVTSPVFLGHSMVPMSDVPAAACWTVVLVLALRQRPLAAGLVASLALLIRPNLLLLAVVPLAAWNLGRSQLPRYLAGLAPGLAAVAVVNTALYGSPLTSGYGPVMDSYSLANGPENLVNYLTWLIRTQSPLVMLLVLPMFAASSLAADRDGSSPREGLEALVVLTLVSYLFYGVFSQWFYLRFVLPAYPAIFVLTAAALRWLCLRLPLEARGPAAAMATAVIAAVGLRTAMDGGVFTQADFERRYERAGAMVARVTPPNAAVLAVQHSGSVRYYANRITLRYDALHEGGLDGVVQDLARRGYPAYIVVDDWEGEEFTRRFGPSNRNGRLDWEPLARVPGRPEVRIYAAR